MTASVSDELERVKQQLSAALNIDLRSPEQIEQAIKETAVAEEKAKKNAEKAAEDERKRLVAVDQANVKAAKERQDDERKQLAAATDTGAQATGAGGAGTATAGPRNNPTKRPQSNDSEDLLHDSAPVAKDKTQSGTGTPTARSTSGKPSSGGK